MTEVRRREAILCMNGRVKFSCHAVSEPSFWAFFTMRRFQLIGVSPPLSGDELVLGYSVGIGGGLQIGFGFTRDPCLCCGSCACAYIAQLSPSNADFERIDLGMVS